MSRRLWLAFAGLSAVFGELNLALDPTGIETFVTRPEIAAPRYLVAKYHEEAITPGYWFVSPYSDVSPEIIKDRKQYIPCQTGAHIYDGNGTLVWSGACQYDNRNVFAFRPQTINGEQVLSFWLDAQRVGADEVPMAERLSTGVILNNRYEEIMRTRDQDEIVLDSHEYEIQDGGQTILHTTNWFPRYEAKELGQGTRWITNNGFRLLELSTGKIIFDWKATDHNVTLNESCDLANKERAVDVGPWDWMHINSVEKSMDGDFLVSARHTHTIYKISGKDGSVIWRLGGCTGNSDFVMDEDVPFAWQHHARWRSENETHTIISLFDNGGEPFELNPNIKERPSSAKVIVLDTASRPMTAKLLRKMDHPNGITVPFLGNVQVVSETDPIHNASILVNWAGKGHISEYDGDGRMVMEAKFGNERQRTYRAFKFPFVGKPTESPAFKVLPIGYSNNELASAMYASWNGATEVKTWSFWGGSVPTGPFKKLASVPKRGFETSWVMPGVVKYAYAVALDADEHELGRSPLTSIVPSREGNFSVNLPTWDPTAASASMQPVAIESDLPSPHVSESSVSYPPLAQAPARGSWLAVTESVIIGAFAIFGAFSMAKNIRQRYQSQRKGYKSMNSPYVDFPH